MSVTGGLATAPSSSGNKTAAQAPAPSIPGPSGAESPQSSFYTAATFQPTKVFTLAFFAIALVACVVLTMFITLTLVRRRRARLQYLSRSRIPLSQSRTRVQRPSGYAEREPPRVIPPLIEGVLVQHPDGEEQVAYALKGSRAIPTFEIDSERGRRHERDQDSLEHRGNASPV